jgi:hypothetical protein
MSGLDCFRLRLRNDAAHVSVITNRSLSVIARPHPVNGEKRGMMLFAGLLHSVRNDEAHVSVITNRSLSVIANP